MTVLLIGAAVVLAAMVGHLVVAAALVVREIRRQR